MNDVFIPAYTTTLVGRARETAEVVALVRDPTIPLVTLTGTSGTGKTRLSIEVFQALTAAEQSVVFVPLAAVTKSEFVLPEIAHQLGVRESGAMELIDLLIKHLEDHPRILILDNFEQVLSAAADLDRLIQALPNLTFLVTSQEPLQLESETVYTIPGLDVPTTIPETPDAALSYAAVQLFVQRIHAVQPEFELSKDNTEPVVEICQMLEGLPLAIELVAAHSEVLLPQDLRVLVKQHLRLYRFRSSASGRQRIILPMIEWSLLRLPQAAQTLFSQLGVFQGGWLLDALEAVVQDVDDLEATLHLLTERHLVLEQAEEAEPSVRYMLLDAVQDFVNTRFAKLPPAEQVALMQRHLHYMQVLTKMAETELQEEINQAQWIKRLRQEVPNIRVLLEWGLEYDSYGAAELSQYLGRFWYFDGYWKEGMQWYDHVHATMELSAQLEAGIAVYYTILLCSLGRYEQAEDVGNAGVRAAESFDDKKSEGRLYTTLGTIAINRQDYKQAQNMYDRALDIAKLTANQQLQAAILGNAATVQSILKVYDRALDLYQEALTLARDSGNKLSIFATLANIGYIYMKLGQPENALEPLTEVIEGMQTLTHRSLLAVTLSFKAQALALCHLPGSVPLFDESIRLLDELGAFDYLASTLDMLAGFFGMHGLVNQAGRIVGGVDTIRRDVLHVPRDVEKTPDNPIFDNLIAEYGANPEFQSARREGESWSMEQVVEYALQALAAFDTQ